MRSRRWSKSNPATRSLLASKWKQNQNAVLHMLLAASHAGRNQEGLGGTCMVSMLASTYQIDELDTLPYLHGCEPSAHAIASRHVVCSSHVAVGQLAAAQHLERKRLSRTWTKLAPPQGGAAGLHHARRQVQLLLHRVQHAAAARVHAEVLKRAPCRPAHSCITRCLISGPCSSSLLQIPLKLVTMSSAPRQSSRPCGISALQHSGALCRQDRGRRML